MKKGVLPQAGDIFAAPLPANAHGLRYAAVRILAANRPDPVTHPQHMVALTRFIGADLPTLDDPAVVDVLRWTGGAAAIVLCCGALPWGTVKVGNLPLSAEDRAYPFAIGVGQPGPDGVVSGYPLIGPIDLVRLGVNAWNDWRWRNDRAVFEAEMAELQRDDQRRLAERVHAPRKPMAAGPFWKLIARLDWEKTGDDDAVIAPVVKALASGTVADIKAFEETLAHMLYLLDTRPHAEQIGHCAWTGDEVHFSVDSFLYARCAAVANGRAFFQRALADPAAMPKDLELEPLLSVAGAAYEERTGKEWDYVTGCDYETFSNRKGWA